MNIINYLIISISVLALIALLAVGVSWFFAKHFCTPKQRPSKKTPANYKLTYEEIQYPSQGILINGWFIPNQKQSGPQATIVIAHGWSSNMAQVLPIAKFLHRAGFATLLFDARSHGISNADNPITLQKFAQDLLSAIDFLDGRSDVDMTRLGVIGHSMGGSGAILAASTDSRIRALVSSAAFADPATLTKEYMRLYHIPQWLLFQLVCYFINRWIDTDMNDIAPKNRISKIAVPILLLHGEADKFVTPSNMEILRSQARPEYVHTQLISGGQHHSTIIKDAEYANQIISFLEKYLGIEIPTLQDAEDMVTAMHA